MNTGVTEQKLTFRVHGRDPLQGTVKNGNARLGEVAARIAKRLSLAGTLECLNRKGEVLSPECRLADLPNNEEIVLAPELTPA
jgi:hypothetical protein